MAGRELTSLGKLASEGAADYFALREAAARVPATLTLNGTRYYGPAAVRRLVGLARGGEGRAGTPGSKLFRQRSPCPGEPPTGRAG